MTCPIRHRTDNPRCMNPVHDASGGNRRRGWFRQRHTCRECCVERIGELADTGTMGKYEIVKRITREFRSYWCPFCLLETPDLTSVRPKDLKTHCTRHAHELSQKRCLAHNRRWTDCAQCEDPRAGSSFCLCGSIKRLCPAGCTAECPDEVRAIDALVALGA